MSPCKLLQTCYLIRAPVLCTHKLIVQHAAPTTSRPADPTSFFTALSPARTIITNFASILLSRLSWWFAANLGTHCSQADVEVSFEVSSLAAAERLDPALAQDAQRLCAAKGGDAAGGVGPFGLWVLASANREERTAVFFRVFRAAARGGSNNKPVVLMCTDPRK